MEEKEEGMGGIRKRGGGERSRRGRKCLKDEQKGKEMSRARL